MVANLKTAFRGEDINWDSIIQANNDGTFNFDIDALRDALIDIGYSFTDAANLAIAEIADTYAHRIS